MILERIPLWPDRDDVAVTAYITPPDPDWPFPADPCPGIVVCPGGAYLNLSPREGAPMALEACVRGYQAFVLEYTVASRAPAGTDLRYPAQLIDLARAITVIREHSARWHLDPDKLALMGFSAGGHLCASYAVHWHEPWLAQRAGAAPEQLRPAAVVLGYPIADYVLQQSGAQPPMMVESAKALFGTAQPDRSQLEALSPCLHVTEHTPPVFLVHAANDSLVPAGNSLHMASALSEAGIAYELHIFQEGDHGFASGQPMDRSWEAQRNRACAAWLPMAFTWLLKQFDPALREPGLPPAEEFFQRKQQQSC